MGDTGDLRLRGYVVQRLLGRGASGDVWRAQVAVSGDPVALKRIWTADAQAAQRARTEAALLTELDHPHLVRLHALIPTDAASVLVLDLADGGSLAQLLSARGRLAPGEVITTITAVGAALAYLHANGVVHGDVSAANILFLSDGSPLLSDVGVARLVGDVAEVYSTAAYVDPAVAAGCVPGPPSDVFMLAAVALHALTGRPPWAGASAPDTLALAARGRLDDLAERFTAAGVPPPMAAVLRRALSTDPHRRGSAADLALDLRHSGEPIAVELGAGRARTGTSAAAPARAAGPRHAAGPVRPTRGRGRGGRPAEQDSHVVRPAVPADPARPAFDRPARAIGSGVGAPPPTRLVGPRPRPVIARPPARRCRARFGSRRARIGAALAAGLAAGGALWIAAAAPHRHAAAPDRHAVPTAVTAAASATASATAAASRVPTSSRASSPPVHRSSDPRPTTAIGWPWRAAAVPQVLDRLDATRARAFATGNAQLLRRVYLPGALLSADTALLVRLVPAGCGLNGARTTYSALRIAGHAGRYTVTATASLAASRLVCEGRALGSAPRAGPATLRLELADTRDGPRIAAQRVS